MKKLLSILMCVILGIGNLWAQSTVKITVKADPTAGGTVWTSSSSTATSGSTTYTSKSSAGIFGFLAASTVPGYIFAKANDGYKFIGWTEDEGTDYRFTKAIPNEALGGSWAHNAKQNFEHTYTAHFVEKVTMDVTFHHVIDGKGSYKATYTLNDTDPYSPTVDDTEATKVELTGVEISTVQVEAFPANGYRFIRWRIVYTDGTEAYDNNATTEINFAKSGTLYCEFIDAKYAQFIVKGALNAYHKLSDAIIAAQSSASKVVVVKESGTLFKETEEVSGIYQNNTYTIPAGITLLVPGDADYTVQMGELEGNDFDDRNDDAFSNFKKISINDGQDFDVYGDICIYAKVHCAMKSMALPYTYGWMELGNNSHIVLQSGANLSVLGYITGNSTNSSVTARAGSSVREVLQVADWRGGEGTSDAISSNKGQYKIFPFSQYYLQNIETKLVLKAGAVEYISSGASVTLVGKVPINTSFVIPQEGNYESGLFRLGEGSQLIKYYDPTYDRQKYEVSVDDGYSNATASLGNIKIDLKLGLIGTSKLESSAYVMPINNNMDITVKSNIELNVTSDVAFLAGTTVNVEKDAIINTTDGASVYIYDAEQHHVKNSTKKGEAIIIEGGKYYNYFGSGNDYLRTVLNRPGTVTYNRKTKDIQPATGTNDDATTVSTKWMKSDAIVTVDGTFNGVLYTTLGGAAITSTNDGIVSFGTLANKYIYQYVQYADNGVGGNSDKVFQNSIPLSTSPLLLNADGSYTEGATSTSYTYYKNAPNPNSDKKGRWLSVVPTGEIYAKETDGDNFALTIPEIEKQDLHFTPSTDVYTISSITNVVFSGDGFALQPSKMGEIKADGTISIPIQYTPTGTHNTSATETATITLNCLNNTSGEIESKDVVIDLSATENYLPAFKINNEEANLQFATTIGAPSAPQTIKINPADADVANVADEAYKAKNYVVWTYPTLPVGSPFQITGTDYYAGVQVVYNPTSIDGTVDGTHTQVLTVKAKYADGVETTKEITLIGTPTLATNPLAFIADEKEIYPNQTISPLFASTGNRQKITFTYNDATTSDIVEIIPEIEDGQLIPADQKFTLKVKDGVDITTQQEITIKATQSANNQFGLGSSQIKVIITPEAQWEWSKLYFGHEYTTPITRVTGNDWTLTQQTPCGTITSFEPIEGGKKNYKIVVSGNGPEDECEVTFLFKRNPTDPGRTFTSAIYADPRILPICFSDDPKPLRTFNDITVATNNVEYSDGILFNVTESAGASWTMQLIGVPNKLQFTPTATNAWTIYESTDGNSWGDPTVNPQDIELDAEGNFTHQLKATTQYIRIICGLGTESGKITNLCITELDDEVSSTTSMVYLPILKDAAWEHLISPEIVNLQYVSVGNDLSLSIQDAEDNTINGVQIEGTNLTENKLPATTIEAPSRIETITIKNATYNPAAAKGTIYLVVKNNQGEEKLKLPIRWYHFPQSLPLRSTNWKDEDAEKYYFYTVKSRMQYVNFDKVTKEIVFLTSSGSQRFITFTFKGGPNYIQFETTSEVTLDNWATNWSIEVSDGVENQVITDAPEITPITDGVNTYYQLRWAIPYTSKIVTILNKRTVVAETIKNIVIDGAPDLDVVQDNHTIEHEGETNFTPNAPTRDVTVTAINLETIKVASNNPNFTVKHGTTTITSSPTTLTSTQCPEALGNYVVGDITFNVTWNEVNTVEEGMLTFTTATGEKLATVRLLGAKDYILLQNANETGFYTGFAEAIGDKHPFNKVDDKYKFKRRMVDLTNAFDKNGVALFDYLIVYGETTTTDASTTVTEPNITAGSNAKTPMYMYKKVQNPETSAYDRYQFVFDMPNANTAQKAMLSEDADITHARKGSVEKVDENMQYISIEQNEQLRVYMTGFCPYATVGFNKEQEGTWIFRGKKNAKLDIYLEDCHIYSRNKTEDGHSYDGKNDAGANIFQEMYARGSGGVLVFECNQEGEYTDSEAFQVTIHTRGKNLLKSNYGCFYQIYGMRAYQVSSPLQIRLTTDGTYEQNSKTHLTLDDKWPTDATDYTKFIRTNGFISLQKQANNAPSIDMGNGNTVVNFRGGQVELQNAQNVSDKYKTTLAISYRSGIMAAGGLNVQMARGIGTDDAKGGIVNFYDGTITVISMKVASTDRKYYLMDVLPDGSESDMTSCLRCPQNTYVYGGSICMLRACMDPTSKGGAPTDGHSGKYLGRFVYTSEHGYDYNTADKLKPANKDNLEQWLVKPQKFPTDITLFEGLSAYYTANGYNYGIESVTPNEKEELILWIPDGYGGVKAEEDKQLIHWEACMTEIQAVLGSAGVLEIGGTVGGNVSIEPIEEVANLLYCDLDENIYEVISANNGDDENPIYTYEAPIKVPEGFQMDGIPVDLGAYIYKSPKSVGNRVYEVTNDADYEINNKIYYITSVSSDVWMTFTAPFDVQNIWVVETYDETQLQKRQPTPESKKSQRSIVLAEQAKNNADFAAFFGAAMALGSQQSFEEIFEDYIEWAKIQDKEDGLYDGTSPYSLRGMYPLTPYDGTNWATANFYLNRNDGTWALKEKVNPEDEDEFVVEWIVPALNEYGNSIMLKKGETYSMLFPYCTGCWKDEWDEGEYPRDNWDYWSGKFLIFESTAATEEKPHVLRGKNFLQAAKPATGEWIFEGAENLDVNQALLTGNSTFGFLPAEIREGIYMYDDYASDERFLPYIPDDDSSTPDVMINPSNSFLITKVANPQGMPAVRITRDGKITYGGGANPDDNPDDGTLTGGHMPTIGAGNALFITSVSGGINISVAQPQYVRVISTTGSTIFNGYITTSTNVQLPMDGVYVIAGETEVHKIFY